MGKKKRGLKRGEASLPTNKLIQAIIVVVVIVIVVLGIASQAKGGVIEKFLNYFPDFIKTNYSVKPPVQCPAGYEEVGYVDGKGYINLNGKKTNLYIDGKEVFVDISWYQPSLSFSRKGLIGSVSKEGVMNFLMPALMDQYEPEFRNFFPESKERRYLFGARIFEGAICLSNSEMERYRLIDNCVLLCSTVNGICSSSPVNGKSAFKQLDCPEKQVCYIDEKESYLSSKDMTVREDSSLPHLLSADIEDDNSQSFITAGDTYNKITGLDSFSFRVSERAWMSIKMDFKIPFCYSFDLDNPEQDLGRGYNDMRIKTNSVNSNRFSYSGEKIIQFAAWNNGVGQKVIKRWKIESKGLPDDYKGPLKIFLESNDGRLWGKNIAYSYKKGEGWVYSYDWSLWFNAVKEGNEKNKKLIESMIGKSCNDGVRILIEKMDSDNKNNLVRSAYLTLHNNGKTENYDGKTETIKKYCDLMENNVHIEPEVIRNEDFGISVMKSKANEVGKIFYVIGLARVWDNRDIFDRTKNALFQKNSVTSKITRDYKMVIDSVDKMSIYAFDSGTKEWHQLYCSKAKVNFNPIKNMNINKASDSLSETLDKYCSWQME